MNKLNSVLERYNQYKGNLLPNTTIAKEIISAIIEDLKEKLIDFKNLIKELEEARDGIK